MNAFVIFNAKSNGKVLSGRNTSHPVSGKIWFTVQSTHITLCWTWILEREKNEVEWTWKSQIWTGEFETVSDAHKAIFWPTPDSKRRRLLGISAEPGDRNFRVPTTSAAGDQIISENANKCVRFQTQTHLCCRQCSHVALKAFTIQMLVKVCLHAAPRAAHRDRRLWRIETRLSSPLQRPYTSCQRLRRQKVPPTP